MHAQKAYPVRDPGDVGEARRAAKALASAMGFDDTDGGSVALVATEVGTNLLKHGGGGELIVGTFSAGERVGIELIVLDRGPGMANVTRCFQDGYSTAGSPGTGLGAVARLSSDLDVYSAPGLGTAMVSRLLAKQGAEPPPRARLQVGVVCLPVQGETVSGDGWAVYQSDARAVAMVVDGLGHGPLAASAAHAAARVFSAHPTEPPEPLMHRLHGALRSTRGAAVAIAELRWDQQQLRFCGVGNIAAGAHTARSSQSFVSQNGTVGLQIRKTQVFDYEWRCGMHLVMHSDGLGSRWDIRSYPGLLARDPSVIAGVLYRDHARKRDDVAVLVAREREVAQ